MTGTVKPKTVWIPWVTVVLGGTVAILGVVVSVASETAQAGSWIVWFGVGVIVLGGALALWNLAVLPALTLRRTAKSSKERLRASLVIEPTRLEEVDPYMIGVFESDLASRTEGSSLPPYVRRDIDHRLDAALLGLDGWSGGRVVAVRGVPKAGKSRSLWEALRRHYPARQILAVKPPNREDTNSAARAPIATLLEVEASVPWHGPVIWVDDAHLHIGSGLTDRAIDRLLDAYPDGVIALTLHSSSLQAIRKVDPALERRLREASENLVLQPSLTHAELARAKDAYPKLASASELEWLPEWFASVNILRDRYLNGVTENPVGAAVAKAAVDWYRVGLPHGISRQDLLDLAAIELRATAPNRILTDHEFDLGLRWAAAEVATRAALVTRLSDRSPEAFQPFDAIVAWDQSRGIPVDAAVWRFALDAGANTSAVIVGARAYFSGEREVAEEAWRGVLDSDAPGANARAGHNLGVLLVESNRYDEAEAVLRRVAASQHPRFANSAKTNLGVLLQRMNRNDEAERLLVEVAESEDPSNGAVAMLNLGLARLGAGDDADGIRWLRQASESADVYAAPKASLVLGVTLLEEDPVGGRSALLASVNSADSETAIKALRSLVWSLEDDGNPEDATTVLRTVASSDNLQVAIQATFMLASRLHDLGNHIEAQGLWSEVTQIGSPPDAAEANINLGACLHDEGDYVRAEGAFRAALASGHDDIAPKAAFNLACTYEERGDIAAADRAFKVALEMGHEDVADRSQNALDRLGDDGAS